MSKYQLIVMGFDGEIKKEFHNFETIDKAWEYSNDMGSRWYFYPFHFVTSESGTTILDSGDGLRWLNGRRVKTVRKMFFDLSIRADMEEANIYNFVDEFISTYR